MPSLFHFLNCSLNLLTRLEPVQFIPLLLNILYFIYFQIPAQTLTVLTIDAAPNPCEIDNNLLGTDYMFLTAFLGKFFFIYV